MTMKNVKIVADSSSDILTLDGVAFESAPLKIITSEREYVDDAELDVREMVEHLAQYKGRSSTSCPNTDDWLKAFGEAENVFCVTITGTLSGSYNSALAAKSLYEETYPERRVYVLNSLTAGPEQGLMVHKLAEFIKEGKEFNDVCEGIERYTQKTGLVFMLESMKNLANNGRVSPLVAKMAGILGIRVVGKASERGDLEPLSKSRGEHKALESIVEHMRAMGHIGGKVRIAHCFNENAGKQLKERLQKDFAKIQVELYRCRGLCSYYAEMGGMLVAFERA